jgi:hypothetical protein
MAKTSSRPRRSSPLRLTGAFELFPISYHLIRDNIDSYKWLLVPGAVIALWSTFTNFVDQPSIWRIGDNAGSSFLAPGLPTGTFLAASGFLTIFGLVALAAYLMRLVFNLRLSQEKHPSLRDVARELTDSWMWLKLIGLHIVVAIVIVLGLIAFVIPGVILIGRLFLAPYIMVDQKTGIRDSIKQSWHMNRGYVWAIYRVILVSFVLSLTSMLPVFGIILSFLLVAAYNAAPALRYMEIKKLTT